METADQSSSMGSATPASPKMAQKKPRNRTPTSCSVCRARKVKCDKTRPVCNSCTLNNFADNCEYMQPTWIHVGKTRDQALGMVPVGGLDTMGDELYHKPPSFSHRDPNSAVNDRVRFLEQQVLRLTQLVELNNATNNLVRPYAGHPLVPIDDCIDFHRIGVSHYQRINRVLFQGPLSWTLLLKHDPFNRIFWKYLSQLLLPSNVKQQQEIDKRFTNGQTKSQFQKTHKPETVPLLVDNLDLQLSILRHAHEVLPNRKLFWMLLDRFFSHVYPLLPFVEEKQFLFCVELLVGPRSDVEERIPVLQIKHRFQIATLGTLLVMLRFASISLCNNDDHLHLLPPGVAANSDLAYLLAHPVDVKLISLAQLCLGLFRMLRKIKLDVLQLAFYIRLYMAFAPEDSDGEDGSDSAPFTMLLVGLTISAGIFRDPSNFQIDPLRANVWRKLWYGIRSLQTYQSFTVGLPPMLMDDYTDTKSPFEQQQGEREMEYFVQQNIDQQRNIDTQLLTILSIISNLKRKLNTVDLILELSKLDRLKPLSSIKQILNLPRGSLKIDRIKQIYALIQYIEIHCFQLSVYHHLMLHFELHSEEAAAVFYLTKLFSIAVEFTMTFSTLVTVSAMVNERGYDIFYARSVLKGVLLSVTFVLSLIVRLEHRIVRDKLNAAGLRNIIVQCKKLLVILANVMDIHSARNYHLYRSGRFCKIVVGLVQNCQEPFFQVDPLGAAYLKEVQFDKPATNVFDFLTRQSLAEIARIVGDGNLQKLSFGNKLAEPFVSGLAPGVSPSIEPKFDVLTNMSNHHAEYLRNKAEPQDKPARIPELVPEGKMASSSGDIHAESAGVSNGEVLPIDPEEMFSIFDSVFEEDPNNISASFRNFYSSFGPL